jgi:hypothetical protein
MDRAGKPFGSPMKVFCPCRGDRPVARSARLILRKSVEAPKKKAIPADAFCAQAPCPPWSGLIDRATTKHPANFNPPRVDRHQS